MALTDQNHQLIAEHFANKMLSQMTAIDATCGNGHDTFFLANLGFDSIFAFDIQQQAIDQTRQQLEKANLKNVTLLQESHENINEHISQKVDCVMFNLGYLPSADKSITTTEKTTLNAIKQSLELLNNGGIMSVLCYPGHPEGAKETLAIQRWLPSLDDDRKITEVLASHPSPKSPVLFLIQ